MTIRDCSERKRSEKELQRLFDAVHAEREWLSQVLTSINDEVYFTDTQKRYTFVNASALEIESREIDVLSRPGAQEPDPHLR